MEKLNVSPDMKLEILLEDVSGDLRVRTWDRDAVGADGDRMTLRQSDDGRVVVRCEGDCRLNVPESASLKARNVAGDARITGVRGDISLDNVAGDLILRDVGSTRLANVSADLRAKRVDGSLHVNNVGADATVREVSSDVHVNHVGADLYVSGVEGSCTVDHVGSDLVLNMVFQPGRTYRFRAGSDVVCRVLAGTNARFIIPEHVEVSVASDDEEDESIKRTYEGGRQIVTFGAGEVEVYIEAGNEVRLVSEVEEGEGLGISADLEFDLGNMGFNVGVDLDEVLTNIEQTLSEKLAGLDERLRGNIEREAARVEKQADRLRRQAEKQAERLARAAERRARKFSFSWGGPPTPPPPPTPPASPPPEPVRDEERLMILRMVENKQITVEEAEKLLAALEGRRR